MRGSRLIVPMIMAALLAGRLSAGELIVRVIGVEYSRGGTINLGLFNSREGFPDTGNEIAGAILPIDGESVVGSFKDLPPGRYVVAVLHDENGDNIMQTRGRLGIPTEGYGFSGTDKARMRPPDFDNAAAAVDRNRVTVDVHLRYP